MKKYWKERIKLFILIALVITSIIQVGILWSPAFSHISSDNSEQLSTDAADKIFMPYRVSLSDGNGEHWIVDRNDTNYKVLWDDAKSYLQKALTNSPSQILDQSQWLDLVTRRSLVFEFRTGIDVNLISWFLNTENTSSSAPENVYKILVSPWDDNINFNHTAIDNDTNPNHTAIYIFDGTRVYKYSFLIGKLSKKSYDDIISSFKNNNTLSSYGMIGEGFSVKPDVLGITDGQKVRQFSNLFCSVPEVIKGNSAYNSSDLLNLAKRVLGKDVYSYDRYIYPDDNTVKFSTVNNTYNIYSDGLMEFTSLQSSAQESRGKIENAFGTVFKFISNVNILSPDSDIYLSGIQKEKDRYIFTFDYIYSGYPIFMEYHSALNNELFTDAITIQANDKTVLSCDWILRNFTKTKGMDSYNVSLRDFFNIQDKAIHDKNVFITDIIPSYVIKNNKSSQKLSPVWVINTTGKNRYGPLEKYNGVM